MCPNTYPLPLEVFVVCYNPRLPSIPAIQQRHWRSMVNQDPYLGEVFPKPPMIGYKRPNIKNVIIRAKVPSTSLRPKRNIKGMKKCNKMCPACPYIMEGKTIFGDNFKWDITKSVDCNTANVIYLIECNKENCRKRYIGESERPLRKRFSEHKGYVRNNIYSQPTGHHFNLPGHSEDNMNITILEKVKKNDTYYRKEREKYLIKKFNTYYRGLNRMP